MPHGPHVRTPTHRRPHFWDRRKAYYRLRRAHPWPGGFCTRWTTDEVSCSYRILIPFRPALPGRTVFPIRQARAWELRAATSLARLWQQQGRREAARQLLAEVYGGFTEGFDTADLREAAALLNTLT